MLNQSQLQASLTIADNDTAGIAVTPTSGLTTTEAGGSAIFTVVLTSKPTADVTINLVNSDTTEASLSTSTLTFKAANWNTAQTVTVTGLEDLQYGDVAYTITGTSSSSDSNYSGKTLASVSLTNKEVNHAPTVATPIGNQTAKEDTAFNFPIPAGTFADVDAGDTLTYSASKADGTSLQTWLTFNPTTLTNSCTPANGDVGNLSIKVTATDSAGAAVASNFDLTVANSCICNKIGVN